MARILVVEDEELLSSIIVRELTNAGHDVKAAYNGEEAIQHAASETPELILLDLIMPKMDGFQVLESLKKDPKTSPIPVVVLSNLGQKEDIEKAKTSGAFDYMVKINFAPKEVCTKVKEIMEKVKK
ncbi:response regulator [Candidatus Parcubacteria bacterium]|nr:MAG: response regulator [Candidatus Parcubacteria bacterium]